MAALPLNSLTPYLTSRDLVKITRTSHGMYRLVTFLLPNHIIRSFGPGCLNQEEGKGSILRLLFVLENAVMHPEHGGCKTLVNLMPETWVVKENSKFKYQLVAADSIIGLERALTHGCTLHPHMVNCARSVAMCDFLADHGVVPTNQGLTIALSNNNPEMAKWMIAHGCTLQPHMVNCARSVAMWELLADHGVVPTNKDLTIALSNNNPEVAKWMIARGLVATSLNQTLKLSPALVEYTLNNPQATPTFIRYVAKLANASNDYKLVRSLVERHGIHSDEHFLLMLRKAPLHFVAWVLTQKLFYPSELMREAITERRLDMMKLITIPPPVPVVRDVTPELLAMAAKLGTVEILEWSLQQDWSLQKSLGEQTIVMEGAVKSGDVAKVRVLNQLRYPLMDHMGDVALKSCHCTVEMLQYLSEHKIWPLRAVAARYLSSHLIGTNINPAVVKWLKSHYWFM